MGKLSNTMKLREKRKECATYKRLYEEQAKEINNIIRIKTKDKGMNCEYEKENKEVIKYIMKELLKKLK